VGKAGEINGSLSRRLEEQAEQALVRSALEKVKAGQAPNQRETRALKRHEGRKEEERLLGVLRSMPQRIVRAVFGGVQCKQLQDMQVRWGLPFAQESIDWFEIGPRLWAMLVKFGKQKAAMDPDGELLEGASKSLKDEYVRQKTRIETMKADEMERKAVYWDTLQPALVDLGTALRKAGELQARKYGPECALILEEAIGEYERKLDDLMGGT
jgi:hypothetical protein